MEPRGIRNNNPGNIRASADEWQGKVGVDDAGFVIFDTPENGSRALSRTLDSYVNKHGLKTVASIVGRYAPSSENDTSAYVTRVANGLGVKADQEIDLNNPETKTALMREIISHENGIDVNEAGQMALGGNNAVDVPYSGPPVGLPSVNPNDSEHWVEPSNLLQPDTTAISRDPLYASGEVIGSIPGQEQDVNLTGGQSGLDKLRNEEAAFNTSAVSTAEKAFQSNNNRINNAWNFVDRVINFPDDPEFENNVDKYREEFQKAVPQPYWNSFAHVRSVDEMKAVQNEINQDLQNMAILQASGMGGMLAMLVAGTLDIDLALAFVSGGTVTAGKLGVTATRIARGTRAGLAGGVSEAAFSAADYQMGPTARAGDFVMNMLGSAGLPALVGTLGHVERGYNQSMMGTIREYANSIKARRLPVDFKAMSAAAGNASHPWPSMSSLGYKLGVAAAQARVAMNELQARLKAKKAEGSADSVGAARNPDRPPLEDEGGMATSTIDAIENARVWREDSGWLDMVRNAGNNPRVQKFLELINKIPGVKTDWESLAMSPSAILNKLSYDLFESAAGIVVNATSSAMLKDTYFGRIISKANPYEHAFASYAQSRGVKFFDKAWDDTHRAGFDREVQMELLRRRAGDAADPNLHPSVKEAADHWQAAMNEAEVIAKGRAPEEAIHGFEDVKHKDGYFPLKWRGDHVKALLNKLGRKTVVREWGAMIKQAHPNLTKLQSQAVAKAFIARALAKNSDVDSSLISLVSGDGRARMMKELEQRLTVEDAKAVMDTLSGKVEEKGKISAAKGRLEIDLRQQFSDGTRLLDLAENDMRLLMQSYAHTISGSAAMARKGIRSNADVTDIVNQALEEQEALGIREGHEKFVSREKLEGMFSYFGSGPVNGGLHPMVRMAKQITNLALLNQLGLAQLAEVGTQIGAVGLKQWLKMAPSFIKDAFAKPGSPRAQRLFHEIEPWTGKIGDAHNVYRPDILLDEIRRDASGATQFMDTVEKGIGKLRRLQGFTNGFNYIQRIQHEMSMEIMLQKVARALKGTGDEMSKARLADIGLSGKVLEDIQQAINTHAEFDAAGNVTTFNFNKWNYDTTEAFATSMNRGTYRLVQRAMAGEESHWMTTDLGALFTHLKAFPILAMKKQFIREGRINDIQTKMVFMYGLGAAAAAYTAKQAINGNFEDMDPGSIAVGALNMSNMTGWIPMWTDPIAEVLGVDSARFSQYGARGIDGGIISTPAALTTLNKMLHIPGAAIDAVTPFTEFTNGDISAIKTIPIVGNAYGIAGILNAMKE